MERKRNRVPGNACDLDLALQDLMHKADSQRFCAASSVHVSSHLPRKKITGYCFYSQKKTDTDISDECFNVIRICQVDLRYNGQIPSSLVNKWDCSVVVVHVENIAQAKWSCIIVQQIQRSHARRVCFRCLFKLLSPDTAERRDAIRCFFFDHHAFGNERRGAMKLFLFDPRNCTRKHGTCVSTACASPAVCGSTRHGSMQGKVRRNFMIALLQKCCGAGATNKFLTTPKATNDLMVRVATKML